MLPGSGVSPGSLFAPQEWGNKGVENGHGCSSKGTGGGHSPPYDVRLDSRFRENDRRGVRLRRTGVWGVPRFPSYLPPRSKIRLRRSGGSRGLKETITDSLSESTYDGFHVQKRNDMLYSYYDDIS